MGFPRSIKLTPLRLVVPSRGSVTYGVAKVLAKDHNLAARYSVISTLNHRARTVCTKPELMEEEIQHLRKALTKSKYPTCALDKIKRKFTNRSQENSNAETREEDSNSPSGNSSGRDPTKDKYNKGHIVTPYNQGLGKNIKKVCRKYGIKTHFKGNRTIEQILVRPKDKDPLDRKNGAIYWYQCGELACDEDYIEEIYWTFGERYKEHMKEPSPIHGHSSQSGHSTNSDNFTIIVREDHEQLSQNN